MHVLARTSLVILIGILLLFGIVMLYSTSYAEFGEAMLSKQLTWIALGSIAGLVIWRCDYRILGRYSWIAVVLVGLALAYLALAFVLYKASFVPRSFVAKMPFVGGPIKGAFRWLKVLPGASIQPSEFAKPIIVLFLADYFGRRARHLHEFKRGFLRPMGIAGAILALIFLGKDLSSTVIVGGLVFIMAFVAGVRLRYLVVVGIAGAILGGLALASDAERMRRLTAFRDPEQCAQAEGYQLWCSQLAMGSGGTRGLGLTNSRMKQYYLPEAHTDFIVAIVGEELGFAAVSALIVLYFLVMAAAFWLGALAHDRQGTLICVGIGLSIGIHAFVNIGVVSGFGPTTGVTAPFLSYGGSSMIKSLIGVGLLLSVSRISEMDHEKERESGSVGEYGPAATDEI
ncbi:MAG: FtsW/RodA/SpoVE family cell cycle protein [Lentisphaerae bacterium]|jgi:cell division protein FtsW|nr:FtsW/RodA/SpoVE family cell cycle protein [Lentisphaerota bacterium]MBT4817351.1 FtsW/RodA/SpoVE family cell cycle protein [Lentisphaerota bacterium]MBT5608133.1 FtsW/RodA/SpoVE family cell cycle protein [Lentisphaerota bacterium]MBT7060590.1 FtsW/RodA/SpoVE family cell cycle protein [Lentisphaerota bacterium]MBT7847689.1 FtsW/RodA/SpoVE family cell cycle protein [Lentisphaerota bacterium]